MAEMVRVNTRISKVLNDWLDEQARVTGVPKSTQIMLALENYYNQKQVVSDMAMMVRKLEQLEKEIKGK